MKTSRFTAIGACLVLMELNEFLCCGGVGPDSPEAINLGRTRPLPFSKNPIIIDSNPHQVAILHKDESIGEGNVHICSGSLIAPEWVLTAAQCVGSSEVRVVLGATNLRDPRLHGMEFTITSKNMIPHPQYRESSLNNDIALIKLPMRMALNRHIQPATIATKDSENYIHKLALLPGWGRSSLFADNLKQSILEVISNERCQEQHREPFFYVQCTNLCTASALSDVCAIDTGAPLFHINSRNERRQIGIVSKAPSACNSSYPTVYTRVSQYEAWVDRVIGSQYLDMERTTKGTKVYTLKTVNKGISNNGTYKNAEPTEAIPQFDYDDEYEED